MSRPKIAAALALLLALALPLPAAEPAAENDSRPNPANAAPLESAAPNTQTNRPPLRTAIVPQIIHGGVRVPLISLSTDRHQFSLAPPRTWRVQSESQKKQVRIVNGTDGTVISVTINESSFGSGPLTPDGLRNRVAVRHPGFKIVEEFTLSALGQAAPAFDLEGRASNGTRAFTRYVLISFAGGYLDCDLTVSGGRNEDFLNDFNYLLLSLRHAPASSKLAFIPVTPD